jgi:hypothetical protein
MRQRTVTSVSMDVDRSLDPIEKRETLAQLQQLVGTGSLHGAVDHLRALRLRLADQQIAFRVTRTLVQLPLRVDAGDLRLELRRHDVDGVLSLRGHLLETRLDLCLLGECAVREHRLVLDLLLLGESLERVGIVVLPDQDVGELESVFPETAGELLFELARLEEPLIAIELLRLQFAEVLLDGRIGESDDDLVLVGIAETEARHDEEGIGDAEHHGHVDRHGIAVDGRHVDGPDGAVVGTALLFVVAELDDLDVAGKRPDRLVAEDLPPVARRDHRLLESSTGAEGDLPQTDLVGSHVRDQAAADEEERDREQKKLQRERGKTATAKRHRGKAEWQPGPEPGRRRGGFEHRACFLEETDGSWNLTAACGAAGFFRDGIEFTPSNRPAGCPTHLIAGNPTGAIQ